MFTKSKDINQQKLFHYLAKKIKIMNKHQVSNNNRKIIFTLKALRVIR